MQWVCRSDSWLLCGQVTKSRALAAYPSGLASLWAEGFEAYRDALLADALKLPVLELELVLGHEEWHVRHAVAILVSQLPGLGLAAVKGLPLQALCSYARPSGQPLVQLR